MKTIIEIDDIIVDLTLQDLLEMEEPINKNNLKISNIYSTIAYELSKRASEEISSLLGDGLIDLSNIKETVQKFYKDGGYP